MRQLPQTQFGSQLEDPVAFVTAALQSLLRQPDGLSLCIDGEEKPYRLVGGTASKVVVGSAWIMFSHEECVFRTKEIKDRDAFLRFLTEGGSPAVIRFTKVCGVLKQPEEPEVTPKQSTFIPRSQYRRERRIGA